MRKKYDDETLYGLALCRVPNVGDALARQMLRYAGSASEVFKLSRSRLRRIPGVGPVTAENIHAAAVLREAERELKFIEQNDIAVLFFYDDRYPQRLHICADAPFVLFAKGRFDFNKPRVISIIGTRHSTEYGRYMTDLIVDQLAGYDFTLVSGLAFGIDVAAHRAALKHPLQNIAVLGHGLDRIYPFQHRYVAEKLQEHGALLSDFWNGTNPDKQNFPRRNRIVAGMCDATIVVESAISGGALITAEIANSYNRDVFAIPGKINDEYSRGCNELIRLNKAQLITSPEDIAKALFWDVEKPTTIRPDSQQALPFPELQGDEARVYQLIRENKKLHLDALVQKLEMNAGALASILLQLEMQGLIQARPGKMYSVP